MRFSLRVLIAHMLCIVAGYSDLICFVRFEAFTGLVGHKEKD